MVNMKKTFIYKVAKGLIIKTPFYFFLLNFKNGMRQKKELRYWEENGRPVPPPHLIKQRKLINYAKEYGLRIFIETGTYYGDMVEAMRKKFDLIYSIELSAELHRRAIQRFKSCKHICLVQGDSGKILGEVVNKINQPALFWLDGHYSAGETAKGSKDTPILKELNHIFNAPDFGHVIVIDDARCFGIDPAYPTIEELKHFICSQKSNASINIQDDSIRIINKRN